MILVFLMLSFKSAFSLSSFTLSKNLSSSSLFSAISRVSSAYLSLLISLPEILIPPWDSSILAFHVMYSASQFSSVTQSCPTLCDQMDCSMPGFPVHHQLPVGVNSNSQSLLKLMSIESVMQSNHLILSSSSPPAFNLSQHLCLFQ